MDFGAYFCKEVLSGIVCSKDEFSCSEFLAPTLASSSRHKMVPKLRDHQGSTMRSKET